MTNSEIAAQVRDEIVRKQPELTKYAAVIYEAAWRAAQRACLREQLRQAFPTGLA